jgi:phosphocarrier protein HPr
MTIISSDTGPSDPRRIILRMQARQVNVGNSLGLHARLAAQIVHVASRFTCSVSLGFKGRSADARNIIAVMLLAASVGSTISIEASGPDEAEALDALSS